LPLNTNRLPAIFPILCQCVGLDGSTSSNLVVLARIPFAWASVDASAVVALSPETGLNNRLSRSSNGVTATECLFSSVSWIIEDNRELVSPAVTPIAPRTRAVAIELASFGLRLVQRHVRIGGEIGRAIIGRPSSQRSRSSARSWAEG